MGDANVACMAQSKPLEVTSVQVDDVVHHHLVLFASVVV